MDPNAIAWTILVLPLAAAVIIFLLLKRWPMASAVLSTLSAFATLGMSIALAHALGHSTTILTQSYPWISLPGVLRLEIGLLVDAKSAGMMLIVTGVGALVHLFSLGYMRGDAGLARFFAGLSLFMFSMTGIVLADNFAMMFIFWELVGVSSYILIGHWFEKDSAADAAKKAFLTNRIGDFGFMIGILLAWVVTKSIVFTEMKTAVDAGGLNQVLLGASVLLIFCGAVGKSAQFPLHVWLPDAMEGPTPVSALIHAATMVAAGVFMLARVAFLVEGVDHANIAATVIAYIGGFTALLAALMATQQNDIKRVLAYSTLSQLGYMVMAQGLYGSTEGLFHLYTHAWFKALLFLGAGAVIFACHHEQDIWKMGGLRKKLPITFATFALGTAALIALPGTSGFWSKEEILVKAYGTDKLLYAVGIGVAALTAFYMTRLFIVAFLGKARSENAEHAHEVGPVMWVPLAVLAFMAVFSGYGFITGGFPAFHPGHTHEGSHEAGFLTTILSLVALAGGVFAGWKLYSGREREPISLRLLANRFYFDELYSLIIRTVQDLPARLVEYLDLYVVHGLLAYFPSQLARGAGWTFTRLQSGHLQGYGFLFGAGLLALLWYLLS
ncbi:MAG: NADH-quinone oxidoreductase subunit L [Verrucomicrobiales bacterium]